MRACRSVLVLAAVTFVGGCNILEGYYYAPKHFRFATVREVDVATPLERSVANVKLLAKQYDMPISKVYIRDAEAQVWATKNGLKYVFDIKASGEQGCRVHFEINQAGNDGLAWEMCNHLRAYP